MQDVKILRFQTFAFTFRFWEVIQKEIREKSRDPGRAYLQKYVSFSLSLSLLLSFLSKEHILLFVCYFPLAHPHIMTQHKKPKTNKGTMTTPNADLHHLFENNLKWAQEIKKNEPEFFTKLARQVCKSIPAPFIQFGLSFNMI